MLALLAVVAALVARVIPAFLDGLFDFFGSIGGDVWNAIKDFVRTIINAVGDAITWTVDNVAHALDSFIVTAWGWVQDATNLAWHLASAAFDFATNLVTFVAGQIWAGIAGLWDWVNNVGGIILGAIASIEQWIATAADNIVGFVWAQFMAFYNDVILGALHFIEAAVNFLAAQVHDLLCGLEHLVNIVANTIGGAVAWITSTGMMVASVVLRALGWLEYFATHPFSWFSDLFGGFARNGSRWLVAHLLGALQSDGHMIEEWLAKWLEL
jgi:phage-related protein